MKITNKNIIKDNVNPLIREKSVEVKLPLSDEDKELLMGLLTYVQNSTDPVLAEKDDLSPAVGIAAIQVGVKKKLLAVVLRDENDDIIYQYALANAKIISYSVEPAYLPGGEGCLSVAGVHKGYVCRHRRIKVRAYDLLQDKEVVIKASDYLAIVLQHEIDHFNGVLFYDHIDAKNPFHVEENAHCID